MGIFGLKMGIFDGKRHLFILDLIFMVFKIRLNIPQQVEYDILRSLPAFCKDFLVM